MSPTNPLIQSAKSEFDLTRQADQQSLYALADKLLEHTRGSATAIGEAGSNTAAPLEFRLAAKLVDSRAYLMGLARPLKIGVVFAMWGEQNRLHPQSDSNPNGEDSLRIKIQQLEWATAGTQTDWTLYPVDDGCPFGSGQIAAGIAASHPRGDKVKVQYLADNLPAGSGPLQKLSSAEASRKGGAIILGCMKALEDGLDAVIYTDSDSSVHLGQVGLLIRPYCDQSARVVIGNRKHPAAVLVKEEGRWGIGIKLLRHMQRMIGNAIFSRGILDSQAAFKLYQRDVLERILVDPAVFDFSFDTDWLLAAIAMDEPITQVPFAFIDSFAESASVTQGPMTTWEMLLKGLVTAVRHRHLPHSEAMARVLDEEVHSAADLEALIEALPPELAQASDYDLGNPDLMSASAVQAWIQQRKAAFNAASVVPRHG